MKVRTSIRVVVPGTGDKDTVPAMLTLVSLLCQGAVQQYGVDTWNSAAAGGTNIPTLQRKIRKVVRVVKLVVV